MDPPETSSLRDTGKPFGRRESFATSETIREEAREVASEEGVSINQFCVAAIARAVGEARARRFFRQRSGELSPEEGRLRIGELLERVGD
jgi:hypothetical protein